MMLSDTLHVLLRVMEGRKTDRQTETKKETKKQRKRIFLKLPRQSQRLWWMLSQLGARSRQLVCLQL